MIFYPKNWKSVGQRVTLDIIECRLKEVVKSLDCQSLSLSGGIDSSLLLWFMVKAFGNESVRCYTIALNEDHPDYHYSNLVGKHFGVDVEVFCPHKHTGDGDEIVRQFYRNLVGRGVRRIVAGDGIDEFMCGYYDHQKNPTEETYFSYLRRLHGEHLKPLNQNSNQVNVFLPYLDEQLISLMGQIPLSEKVDFGNRKKIMAKMAQGKIPNEIIQRHKYGFCDALRIKENGRK